MADESNVGVAISATFLAGVASHLHQTSTENTAPFVAVSCCVFPALCVDVQGFHVMLADISVAQLGAANSSLARGKFAIEDVLWDVPILHPAHVAEPSQPAWSEQREHGGKTSRLEDLGTGHLVTPMDAEDAAQAVHVEAVQFALLFGVCRPCLAAVEESADDAGIVHCHLCWNCQLWVLPDAGGEAS